MLLLVDYAVIFFTCLDNFHTKLCYNKFPRDVDIVGVLGIHPGFHSYDVLVFTSQTLSHGIVPDFVTSA